MKRRDLERALAARGARLLRHGSRHDVWLSQAGFKISVPRHREIKEHLAQSAIAVAELRK